MLGDSLKVLLTGFGVVFFGLFCLIGIIYLMSFIVRLVRREETPVRNKPITEIVPEYTIRNAPRTKSVSSMPTGEKRRELVAAVSAALSEYLGSDASGFRIHSIRPVGASSPVPAPDRRELVAVISAAIASQLDTDVSGIRIHSIKKVS